MVNVLSALSSEMLIQFGFCDSVGGVALSILNLISGISLAFVSSVKEYKIISPSQKFGTGLILGLDGLETTDDCASISKEPSIDSPSHPWLSIGVSSYLKADVTSPSRDLGFPPIVIVPD